MMKVLWPFGVALRRVASSRLMLHWLMTVVVSDEEKAPFEVSGRDREGERERIAVDVSKFEQVTSEPRRVNGLGISLAGGPLIGQAVSGMEATRVRSAAFTWNRRKRAPIPSAPFMGVGDRECLEAGRP